MKNFVYLLLPFVLLPFAFCKKEFDTPPLKQANDGTKITIAVIKARYYKNMNYKFKADSNLYCVVTADEVSGSFYKDVYVRDASGAIRVKLLYSGGLYIGDSIRINLKGIVLNEYNSLIQLDSVDLSKSVVKLASGLKPQALTVTLEQIHANTAATSTLQSQLVRINRLEFFESDRNVSFADAIGKTSKNLKLRSCSGQSITLRNSGYSNFAAALTPNGNGYIVAILGQFGDEEGDMQLTLRQYQDIKMDETVCATQTTGTVYLKKDFNDNSISSGGWSQYKVTGDVQWSTSSAGGANSPYAKISNYISGNNQSCETWLISPLIDLSDALQPVLSFRNAYNYTGPELELYVSNNYTSGTPSSASWIKLNFRLSSGSWVFVNSGAVDLSDYLSANTRVAFRYTGTENSGSTWEIDDVLVKNK
jgi:hypothetical protein